jgi:hypothetical protein
MTKNIVAISIEINIGKWVTKTQREIEAKDIEEITQEIEDH